MANIFISGISSGIGKALALRYACQGHLVYGLSRRAPDYAHERIRHRRVDLARLAAIGPAMAALLDGAGPIELAILGAAAPGRIGRMAHASMDELKAVMDVNLWAQKALLDALMAADAPARQVVAISSGASVRGELGWSGYALSKCALNMLVQLYASEYPSTHFVALAPGLVATAMQEYVYHEVSAAEFPSVAPLHAARGTAAMPGPEQFARDAELAFARLGGVPSGAYVDLRDLAALPARG
jgi:NAD(P)-dependent dehydrogenase (short-subunit alcohol dehydrogenase family)